MPWIYHNAICRVLAAALAAGALNSCVTSSQEPAVAALSVGDVARYLPPNVTGRDGWAADIYDSIDALGRPVTEERACAVIAIIGQESNFQPNPVVANLPKIVHDGLKKKLGGLGILAGPALDALLSGHAPGVKDSFAAKIGRLRTERDLDVFFREMETAYGEKFPGPALVASALSHLLGHGSLEDLNPVTTAGSMQVKVAFARTLKENEDLTDAEVRELLYTRRGGVRAGTARLLGYAASYDDVIYRFADYNAGVFSSRNAAFQQIVADLSGKPLALDGDLLAYDSRGKDTGSDSKSLKALLVVGHQQDMWDWSIRRQADQEKSADFEATSLWENTRTAWEKKHGQVPPYARIPEVELISPKMAAPRSTVWFAKSVKQRYLACRSRAH